MKIAYISLGSNMGDCRSYLQKAIHMLSLEQGIEVISNSPIYLTEPQGIKEQAWFHNQVIKVSCRPTWSAQNLLHCLQEIEQKLGRARSTDPNMQNGPRCIDLDLLFFDDEIQNTPQCTIPHPRIKQRAFVLIPLRHVAKGDILPIDVEKCLKNINYRLDDEKIFQE